MVRVTPLLLLAAVPLRLLAAEPTKKIEPVVATVETTLKTASGHIRQFAFDGNPDTYFASEAKPGKDDNFTLIFDKPVRLKTLELQTGRAKAEDVLASGRVELSTDGKVFKQYATVTAGSALGTLASRLPAEVKAIRIVPGELAHPLVIREIRIESDPPVAAFKDPVEVAIDVSDAPEMREWAEKTARVCERVYPMINEQLKSEGYKPPTFVTMTMRKSYKGVAETSGARITGSVKYFQDHPDDIGAMVHETVHVVQHYRSRNNPGWLVEGIADYIRFFKYEPGKIGRLNVDRARYNGSYRVTAAFLNYATEKYDKDLVKKLNKAMREGEYTQDLWKQITKKSVQELGDEWKASLKK